MPYARAGSRTSARPPALPTCRQGHLPLEGTKDSSVHRYSNLKLDGIRFMLFIFFESHPPSSRKEILPKLPVVFHMNWNLDQYGLFIFHILNSYLCSSISAAPRASSVPPSTSEGRLGLRRALRVVRKIQDRAAVNLASCGRVKDPGKSDYQRGC